jgi:hypothetical protein
VLDSVVILIIFDILQHNGMETIKKINISFDHFHAPCFAIFNVMFQIETSWTDNILICFPSSEEETH